MNDSAELYPVLEGSDTQSVTSGGSLLRRAREAAGMHIGTLAVTLKVPVRKLEALESDRWDLLPDAVFARALAASVCRTLKIDPAIVLEHLPTTTPRLMSNDGGFNTPFHGVPGPGAGSPLKAHLSRPLGLAVLALMLGALGLIFWPANQSSTVGPSAEEAPMTKRIDTASVAPGAPTVSEAMTIPAQPTPTTIVVDAGPASSMSAAGSSPSIAVQPGSFNVLPVESTSTGPEPKAVEPQTIVMFKATGPSWIQVTDAKGAVVLKKLLGAGESASAAGLLPLAVLVGRVDTTTVEIRGKPFDLASVARDNVARFEVKP